MAKTEGTYIPVAYKNVFGYISTNFWPFFMIQRPTIRRKCVWVRSNTLRDKRPVATGLDRFFFGFSIFQQRCNWQPKNFRIFAPATGGLVFCSWVQFDFGLFSSPANWTCEHYYTLTSSGTACFREQQGDYKQFSDKISILPEEEERLGIPEDYIGNSSIAQLTHDICHMNHLPTVHDLHVDSPQWPWNHTQPMQNPSVPTPFTLETPISHSYQQQMDIFYWVLNTNCGIFCYLTLTVTFM